MRPTDEQLSKMIVFAREEGCVCELESALIELKALRAMLPQAIGRALEALSRAYDRLEDEGVVDAYGGGLGEEIREAAKDLREIQSAVEAAKA